MDADRGAAAQGDTGVATEVIMSVPPMKIGSQSHAPTTRKEGTWRGVPTPRAEATGSRCTFAQCMERR
eukprot:6073359-Karenia_brevis.AAC.1